MGNNGYHILCTRPLSDDNIAEATAADVSIDMLSFIETRSVDDAEVKSRIAVLALQNCNVIFTSMNAAEMVIDNLKHQKPSWNIFCMGNTTRQITEQHFGKKAVAATGNDAVQLAKRLMTWRYATGDNNPIIFFCGDQRRDELPALLKENKVAFEEIVVYNTMMQYHVINRHYDGILFFSPSAVHSFFTTNTSTAGTVFFAIGNTTAKAIRNYTQELIVVGSSPAKEQLLKEAVSFFQTRN